MPGIKRMAVGLALFLALSGCYSSPRLKDGLTPKSRVIQEYIVQIKKEYDIRELDNKVRYVEFSKISKDSIIILNDLDGSFKWYEEFARELNKNYAVYIFDKRGSGVNADKRGSATDLVKDIDKLIDRIEKLALDPFPQDVKRVVNQKEKVFRVRVGDYRIQYMVFYDRNLLFISDIEKRPRAY